MIQSKRVQSFVENIKDKINNIILENKIEQEFKNNNTKFSLYTKDNIIPIVLYGKINNNEILVYGDCIIEQNSIIVNECNKKAYYAISSSKQEIQTTHNSNIYIRKGTKILLDENVKEVKVIKAKNKYYLLKD